MTDVRIGGIVIDCDDPIALAEFWSSVIGFRPRREQPFVPDPEGDVWASLSDPEGIAPNLSFQKVPEAKSVKNRVHIDLYAEDEEVSARRIVELGATQLWRSTDPEDPFVVLADPEGNEFCVVRPRAAGG